MKAYRFADERGRGLGLVRANSLELARDIGTRRWGRGATIVRRDELALCGVVGAVESTGNSTVVTIQQASDEVEGPADAPTGNEDEFILVRDTPEPPSVGWSGPADRLRTLFQRVVDRLSGEELREQQGMAAALEQLLEPFAVGNSPISAVQLHAIAITHLAERAPDAIDLEKRRTAAFHEAGHALAAARLGIRFDHVSVAPTVLDGVSDSCLGFVRLSEVEPTHPARDTFDAVVVERYAVMQWCGIAAQELAPVEEPSSEVRGYHRRAAERQIARLVPHVPDGPRRALADYHLELARDLIRHGWPAVEALASALFERRRLTEPEVMQIIGEPTTGGHDGHQAA